ncbi:hypothetical protein TNIN_454841 [Trichonephila inaurata madagascariensis]|uniref:Uncharacterized protein n=1 Tax=Trichonephila inaurata madagascariensis TaxID=2747483 RepID=A0A8X7C1N3_9ARAC|nr:hypothetical protein TNIN_454841 [Trichonephila inaurata madagascariensis]
MFRRGLHRVVVCIYQIGLLSVKKEEALYVSTCKSRDVGLDSSIRLDDLGRAYYTRDESEAVFKAAGLRRFFLCCRS